MPPLIIYVFTFAKNTKSHRTLNEVVGDEARIKMSIHVCFLLGISFRHSYEVCMVQVTLGTILTHVQIHVQGMKGMKG